MFYIQNNMYVGIVGINHKSSSLPLREALARAFEIVFIKRCGVLLSTCNRTEFYFCARSLAEAQVEILALLREEMEGNFEHALYSYFGKDCFHHLGKTFLSRNCEGSFRYFGYLSSTPSRCNGIRIHNGS